jgi:hypothetical protein
MDPAGARTDPWRCRTCGRPADLAGHALEVGLVRLAVVGEGAFRLGSAGVEDAVAGLLERCPCGGRLAPGGGAGPPLEPAFDAVRLAPVAARGWAVLERTDDARLARLRAVWRPRALRLLGRDGELTKAEALQLKLEGRLGRIAADMARARAAGDADAAEALHARYIELGTLYVGRFASPGGPAARA